MFLQDSVTMEKDKFFKQYNAYKRNIIEISLSYYKEIIYNSFYFSK
jgi:hypothetical protein